jgi:hypothetical protein
MFKSTKKAHQALTEAERVLSALKKAGLPAREHELPQEVYIVVGEHRGQQGKPRPHSPSPCTTTCRRCAS